MGFRFGRALLGCGAIRSAEELLEPLDEAVKNEITRRLQPQQGGGFGTPGALNAFLVAMIYFEPGTMRVDGAESKLPSWLCPIMSKFS